MTETHSKLELKQQRIKINVKEAQFTIRSIFSSIGCTPRVAEQIAEHLIDSSLCGVESHGLMRALQYADQFKSGYIVCDAEPTLKKTANGGHVVDGGGGIGIPAMQVAFEKAMSLASETGISALAVKNVGHTGRCGAFADNAAGQGFLTILIGGGNRKKWRQVAPYGGARAMLPTNPWCIGMPGGLLGPIVLDFATSKIAGGWIYAAKSAGALLPAGCLIDKEGNPTRDPNDYFSGGAILPAGEHKGYGLALIAELIGEAMLGPVATEANWLLICIKTGLYNSHGLLTEISEEILNDMRLCPPAPGFLRVEIPGERERNHKQASDGIIAIPEPTWLQIKNLESSLCAL